MDVGSGSPQLGPTRRRVAPRAPMLMAAVVVASILAACGGSTSSDGGQRPQASSTSTPAGTSSADTAADADAAPAVGGGRDEGCAEPGLATTVRYRELPGVDADAVSLDIHAAAAACDAPVVLWVHGGGYQIGDKSRQMTDKIRLFNDRGWILVSTNYRLTEPGDADSARFPDHYDDVAAAIAWVHDEIGRYGGDPDRIALLGHSAGADIVANVTTNPTYLEGVGLAPSDLACAGPLDTAGFDKTALDPGSAELDQWEAALGNAPDHLAATSGTLLAREGVGTPPTVAVIRGRADRQRIAEGYLDALEAVGVPTTLIDARSLSHAEVNARIGAPGDTVMTPPLLRFLDDCFAD